MDSLPDPATTSGQLLELDAYVHGPLAGNVSAAAQLLAAAAELLPNGFGRIAASADWLASLANAAQLYSQALAALPADVGAAALPAAALLAAQSQVNATAWLGLVRLQELQSDLRSLQAARATAMLPRLASALGAVHDANSAVAGLLPPSMDVLTALAPHAGGAQCVAHLDSSLAHINDTVVRLFENATVRAAYLQLRSLGLGLQQLAGADTASGSSSSSPQQAVLQQLQGLPGVMLAAASSDGYDSIGPGCDKVHAWLTAAPDPQPFLELLAELEGPLASLEPSLRAVAVSLEVYASDPADAAVYERLKSDAAAAIPPAADAAAQSVLALPGAGASRDVVDAAAAAAADAGALAGPLRAQAGQVRALQGWLGVYPTTSVQYLANGLLWLQAALDALPAAADRAEQLWQPLLAVPTLLDGAAATALSNALFNVAPINASAASGLAAVAGLRTTVEQRLRQLANNAQAGRAVTVQKYAWGGWMAAYGLAAALLVALAVCTLLAFPAGLVVFLIATLLASDRKSVV